MTIRTAPSTRKAVPKNMASRKVLWRVAATISTARTSSTPPLRRRSRRAAPRAVTPATSDAAPFRQEQEPNQRTGTWTAPSRESITIRTPSAAETRARDEKQMGAPAHLGTSHEQQPERGVPRAAHSAGVSDGRPGEGRAGQGRRQFGHDRASSS